MCIYSIVISMNYIAFLSSPLYRLHAVQAHDHHSLIDYNKELEWLLDYSDIPLIDLPKSHQHTIHFIHVTLTPMSQQFQINNAFISIHELHCFNKHCYLHPSIRPRGVAHASLPSWSFRFRYSMSIQFFVTSLFLFWIMEGKNLVLDILLPNAPFIGKYHK